ncbi:LysR family transcriptional regulator [Liquorilactobacillus mali]|uniref:LysR family transcriptional regulator n=1 Tax=Liquorilactobacillus mali KCTC 3596 = DSM 20444 TaxID=1046596 RepID=J0L5J0_9LACO|nr:LysR family transcriptional regulator [Liquorilactobacillus mali]EJE99361.1 LysR family transcriptional regulator [Liquorilactobacillus mali KCTC 3596 = DSM 20444]KRN09329.1 LysR family transcriptional regulator [Liquorilactobacillus mali KCTC 3596 = DSM 20444]QFQ74669.1 LysR family transcriptional regulator [Liquorilactobacillus mali]
MNLNSLKYFVDVVKLGSFTAAGKKNLVAQTSISQQIHQLEEHFDCLLIDRSRNPVVPTKEGQVLFDESEKVLKQFQLLEKAVQKSSSKKIKIQYSSIMDVQLLSEILDTVTKKNDFNIEIEKVSLSEISKCLNQKKYDFAVTFDSEFYEEPDIETIVLYQGKYLAGVGTQHPLYNSKFLTMKQVYSSPLIMLSPEKIGKSYQLMLNRSLDKQYRPQISYLADDVESELLLIQQKKLLGFFPEHYPLNLNNNLINLIPIVDNPHKYKIVLAYKEKNLDRTGSLFLNAIKELRRYRKNL